MSFEALDSLQASEARKTIVFITAPWCKYCKAMKSKVFPSEEVSEIIKNDFYYLEFDGETTQETIEFAGHQFKYLPTGNNTGVHELALELGSIDGKLEYPTFVVLNEKYEIVFQYAAFMNKRETLRVLKRVLTD